MDHCVSELCVWFSTTSYGICSCTNCIWLWNTKKTEFSHWVTYRVFVHYICIISTSSTSLRSLLGISLYVTLCIDYCTRVYSIMFVNGVISRWVQEKKVYDSHQDMEDSFKYTHMTTFTTLIVCIKNAGFCQLYGYTCSYVDESQRWWLAVIYTIKIFFNGVISTEMWKINVVVVYKTQSLYSQI